MPEFFNSSKLKTCSRESKKEKNVLNVFKAEDVEGHKGEEDINSVLQVRYNSSGIYVNIDFTEHGRKSGREKSEE